MTKKKLKNQTSLFKFSRCRILLLCFFVSLLSGCFSQDQTPETQSAPTVEETFSIPEPTVNLAAPLEISEKPEDVALCEKINQTIEQSQFSNARWGIIAINLKDGRVACGRDARKLFNPASAQKILTSIVALDKLGADFRWQTKIVAEREIENGELNGDLTLYGTGAPDFNDAGLENLINQLQAKGLKKVKGGIVGDESFFRGDSLGDGWTWNEIQWYYGAEASALSINNNRVSVSLQNGKPQASPATSYVQLSGEISPNSNGEIESIGLKRELGGNQIYVWGQGKNLDARVAVQNPALWAAKNLKDALVKRGIAVEGEARSANWKNEQKTNAVELASFDSQTLGEIVRRMNKDSVNLDAELILRTLGKKFGESAPDDNPKMQKLRGDDRAGASVIKKWLTENNVATEEIKIHDGSGLSRLDFVTPEALGRALVYAAQSKFADVFRNSLPVAGTDGTLRGRLGNVRGRVLAKTGSITYVNALAGYANRAGNENYAFAILCNNQTQKTDSSGVIDSIAAILTGN